MFEYWSALRAGCAAPYKSDVTAEGLGRTLAGNVFMMERLADGALRYRLAGSRLYDMFGIELRGMSGPTIMETDSRTQFRSLVDECLSTPGVGVVHGAASAGADDRLTYELALAPLRSDFDQMNRLLGCIVALDRLDGDISPAPRRCRIARVVRHGLDAAIGPARAVVAEGFGEDGAPFGHEGLRAIDGGAGDDAGAGARRRGHLRLVKD